MQTKNLLLVAAATLALGCPQFSALAQGSLTPPGAPAPTMKTADQIYAKLDPRVAITNSGAVTIAASGSYYLTTNITVSSGDAITITASDVTLDLNGFTIASTRPTATTDTAILLSGGRTNVAIYNGHISSGVTNNAAFAFTGGGFGSGIQYSGAVSYNVRVKDVSVAGVLHQGIYLNIGNSSVAESCTVNLAGNNGIVAESVSDSAAQNCGTIGIFAYTAHNCIGSGVGSGGGLTASTAINCSGDSSGSGTGLNAATANNCTGSSAGSGKGLDVPNGVAIGCVGYSASGIGISAKIANSCMVGSGTTNITYKYNMP